MERRIPYIEDLANLYDRLKRIKPGEEIGFNGVLATEGVGPEYHDNKFLKLFLENNLSPCENEIADYLDGKPVFYGEMIISQLPTDNIWYRTFQVKGDIMKTTTIDLTAFPGEDFELVPREVSHSGFDCVALPLYGSMMDLHEFPEARFYTIDAGNTLGFYPKFLTKISTMPMAGLGKRR